MKEPVAGLEAGEKGVDYRAETHREADKYRKSLEGIKAAKDLKREIEEKQKFVDDALENLDDIIHDDFKLMAWLPAFVRNADYRGVKFSYKDLAEKFKAAGYENNQHVGKPREFFECKDFMLEYIMGQVINCLENGMPPHPITEKFVDQYFDLKK